MCYLYLGVNNTHTHNVSLLVHHVLVKFKKKEVIKVNFVQFEHKIIIICIKKWLTLR